jgi:hypothetical protein
MASDCRSISLSGAPIDHNADSASPAPATHRGRGRGRRSDHALAGLLFNLGQSVRGFGRHPGFNAHSGRQAPAGGGSASRGGFGNTAKLVV